MPAPSARPLMALAASLFLLTGTAEAGCQEGGQGLGVSRIVEIDTAGGPVYGAITKRERQDRFLGPKEVVLTFDDGPMPGVTRQILDTLDRFCTKATFFSVGKMAIAYPQTVREILARGHTLGTHTWSHPLSLPRLKGDSARDQIESGFAAVALAAGRPIAPFFRFPGLSDSPALIEHLENRAIATFSVDVVSNDSYISDPARLIERTLAQVEAEHGGIMLFHDIKPQTARALPTILGELKARGYKVVHMRSKEPFRPDERYVAAVRDHLSTKNPLAARSLVAMTEVSPPPAPPQAADAPAAADTPATSAAIAPPMPAVAMPASEPAAGSRLEALAAAASPGREAAADAAAVGSARPLAAARAAAPATVPATAPGSTETALASAAPAVTVSHAGDPQAGPAETSGRDEDRPVRRKKTKSAVAHDAPSRPTPSVHPASASATSAAPVIRAAVTPPPAASMAGQGIEIIAGNYSAKPANAAVQPVAPLRGTERSWSDTFRDRMREMGN